MAQTTLEDKDSKRHTRWPSEDGKGKPTALEDKDNKSKLTKHQRSFPGQNYQTLPLKSLSSLEIPATGRLKKDASAIIPAKIPFKVNVFDLKTRITQKRPPPIHWVQDPWDTYLQLRTLDRGGIVTAAYTRKTPVEMVTIKEIRSAIDSKDLKWYTHCNLIAFLESYQFGEKLLAVTEYTVATLDQVIASPLALEEKHISAVSCQVFEGMRHLSRSGLVLNNLNTSKILFTPDGCVKIDDYQPSTSTPRARPLGVIAIEMMQTGIPPDPGHGLILRHPDQWSPEAANFLAVASWSSLDVLDNNKFLKCSSPTIMIPHIESARCDTIEEGGTISQGKETEEQAVLEDLLSEYT
ncbi:hypothetical protein V500_04178 [Pseudogymnoascus sp. VKM F-4518 (FW-2643)]|nr:hypothetical protein V500_04178 [Pseudogymnoascus sp. VKM F-4518 (FW-2643)]